MQRICGSLAAAGYQVRLVGWQRPASPPLVPQPYQQHRLGGWFQKGKLFYAEYNLRLFCYLLGQKAAAWCAADLDTALPVWLRARLGGQPFVYDAHELFTEVPEVVARPAVQRVWRWVEGFVVPRARLAYTVGPALARVFGQRYGRPFAVVRNVSRLRPDDARPGTLPSGGYLLYQGALNVGRGLENLLEAMPQVAGRLVICGEGDLSAALRERAAQLGLLASGQVEFRGFVLPEALRTGFAKDILQDQISAQHPYASFVLPPLGTAAGILHTNPVPVYIPQDPLLGQYYSAFADLPAALEEDAKDNQSNVASLDYAKNLVSTDKMLERLLDDNDNAIDQVAFARSRLFDMWIGDWDRHEDQWRWAEVKDKDGNRTYTAVPEDRDIAFFKGDGVLPFIVSRKFAVRNFQNFGPDYADYKGLNQTAMSNDRTFLGGVTREQWVAQATYMKEHLTDAVIEQAFREKWPKEIYDLHGKEIIAKLKSRRDLLPDLAAKYANVVAKIVEVRGTQKNEKFVVDRLPNGDTHLTVRKITKGGKVSKTLYDRTLEHGVTDELRLYGISGKDVYEVKGQVKKAIKLRIVAGTGRDSITDRSRVAGFQHQTQVYDADTGNVIVGGKEARLRLEPGVDVSRYDHPKRFDLKDYRLNYTGPALFFGYNIDDGFLLGGGITHRRYGFRREPFSSEQSLTANFAPARNGAYNLKYTGQFTRLIGKYDLHVAAQYYGPQLLYNFFGIGNNTANLANEDDSRNVVTNRTVNTAYRVRFNKLTIAPTLERNLFSFLKLGVGPQYEQFRVEQSPIGTVILDSLRDRNGNATYENRRFGIRSSDFQTNQYLGGLLYLNLDASSSPKNPRIGIRWYNEFQYNWQLNGEKLQFGRATSEIRAYLTPNLPFQITYAGRLGITHNVGDYRFYQANTLGGTTNLRGYRRTRYAGRGSVYANVEARLQLLSFNAYLFPGKLGILGLADVGRVYSDNDVRTGLSAFHSGFGGGVYVDILKQAVINATYSVGEEKLVFVGFDFLF